MDTRQIIFLAIMIALGAAALLAFIVFLIVQGRRRALAKAPASASAAKEGDGPAAHPTPAAVRLLGLLALLLAFLLLDWAFLDNATGYAAMVTLVYPAALAMMLVLLFDKATRSWAFKSGMAGFREWLFSDLLAFLLILSFVNLWMSRAGERYDALFWDVVGLLLLFVVFWLLDRKATRYRFLVAYGYLVLLPMGLLIWATVQDVPARLGVAQGEAPALFDAAPEPEQEVAEAEPDTGTAVQPDADDEVPDWARDENAGAAAEEEVPDWAREATPATPPASQAAALPAQEEVPDWLREESAAAPPPTPQAAAQTPAQEDVPDWAREDSATASSTESSATPAEATPDVAEPEQEAAEEETVEETAAIESPGGGSWWESIWPFFAWAAVFFVLEIIGLIAFEESDKSLTLLLKDSVFVLGYAILLLIAAR